tara:strand:- start:151 stop:276 length:126 start_codon:yes stop_codon:yes gene_type:complete
MGSPHPTFGHLLPREKERRPLPREKEVKPYLKELCAVSLRV